MTVPADHEAAQTAAWQAYWQQVEAAAARHRQALAQQRSDTAANVTIGVGLALLYPTLVAAMTVLFFAVEFIVAWLVSR